MFERLKKWLKKNKKVVVATAVILAVTGTVVTIVVSGKKVNIPINELGKRIIPEKKNIPMNTAISGTAQEVVNQQLQDEMVSIEVEGITKVFPRSEFIRQLHEGWNASEKKLLEAAERGITLQPGETIVNPCMVTMKTNGIV
jgi:hypothetical protein